MAKKFATLKDVANLSGTTVATASFVLNGAKNRYITGELRTRVEKAAKELNYVKHGAASSLKGEKTGIIAVLSPQYENRFFSSIFASIERILNDSGYVIATLNTFDEPWREKHAISQMIRLRADGFLVIPTIEGGENTEYIRTMGLPFVSIERPLNGVDDGEYDCICSDNFGASYALTKYTLEQGHRKIALVYWENEISSKISNLIDRKLGYVKALSEYGIDDLSLVFKGDIVWEEGASITREILKQKDVTAIVYAHYVLAEGGIRYLRENNICVPEDISVSFLGAPYWTDMMETDFTHIIQPGWEIGRQAAIALIDHIEGRKSGVTTLTIPVDFYEGKSVAKL